MATYVPIGKRESEVGYFCCCKQPALTRNSPLTRRCVFAILIVCLLTVVLLFAHWAFLSPSRSGRFLFWNYCPDEPQLNDTSRLGNSSKVSTLSERCTGKVSSDCHSDKPPTSAVSTGLLKSYNQGAPACPASALAQLAENVYTDDELPIRRLPQCLIIGVRKGGTRALLEFLNLHPDVQAERQEVHFFDRDNRYRRGIDWYRRQMRETHGDQLTLEKTPAYFVENEVASRVHQMNSSIRLLVTFRDPIERAISDYLQIQEQREAKGKSRLSFERLVIDEETGDIDETYKAVRRSMYDVHLTRWLHYFSRSQFHFLSAENLVANPANELQKVETFLGLRHRLTKDLFYFNASRGFYCMCVDQRKLESNPDRQVVVDGKCLSSSKGRTHPTIDPHVLKKLRDFFRPHNERLYRMVGMDFGWK